MLQVVMQFKIEQKGWSEVHYFGSVGSNAPADLIDNTGVPIGALGDLISKRRALLPFTPIPGFRPPQAGVPVPPNPDVLRNWYNPRLVRVRVSQVDPGNFRVVRVYTPPILLQFGKWIVDAVEAATETWTRLLIACLLDNNNNGHIWLGGTPESQLGPPEEMNITANYQAALDDYFATLTASFLTRLRPKPSVANPNNPPVINTSPITSLLPQLNGLTAQVVSPLVPPQGVTQGQLVVRGRHPSEWNGIHRFQYITAGPGAPYFLLGPSRTPLGDWAVLPGTVQLMAPSFQKYIKCSPERYDHRPAGDPFGRSPGRRKRAR